MPNEPISENETTVFLVPDKYRLYLPTSIEVEQLESECADEMGVMDIIIGHWHDGEFHPMANASISKAVNYE